MGTFSSSSVSYPCLLAMILSIQSGVDVAYGVIVGIKSAKQMLIY